MEEERLITIDGSRIKTTQAARAMLLKLRASYERDVDHIMVSYSYLQILNSCDMIEINIIALHLVFATKKKEN